MIHVFFKPYASVLIGAAYNIQQTLEGLGIWTSSFVERDNSGRIVNAYWSATEAMALPLGLLLVYSTVMVLLALLAGYCFRQIAGVFSALVIVLLPGLLSMIGWWPEFSILPETYHAGAGSLGVPEGMFSVVVIALLSGWLFGVLVTDALRLNDRFRQLYDHAWYSAAILAGVFFVADQYNAELQAEFQSTGVAVRQVSNYLLPQVRAYENFCRTEKNAPVASCQWAQQVQQLLTEFSSDHLSIFVYTGPGASEKIYRPHARDSNPQLVTSIRQELMRYNDNVCPRVDQKALLGVCLISPGAFLTTFDPPIQADDFVFRRVAIANEMLIPTLVRLHGQVEKLAPKIDDIKRSKHLRWLFFVLFSVLAGGKVANATVRAFPLSTGQGRSVLLFSRTLQRLRKAFGNGVKYLLSLARVGS
jgi:hypothetical protein